MLNASKPSVFAPDAPEWVVKKKSESRGKSAGRRPIALKDAVRKSRDQARKQLDAEFARQRADVETWLAGFNPEDACLALCISDLWVPNISSQVKHIFAFGVAASMDLGRFTATRRIETYAEFRQFIAQLHVRLPSFSLLEDYVPEADWGRVRIESDGDLLRILYGGAVERISDYVTAFLMLHGGVPEARRDIHAALTVQDRLVSSVDTSIIGSATDIQPGHLEVPAEQFWAACRKALLTVSDLTQTMQVDDALVAAIGQFAPPRSWSEFGDAVMTGSALPVFLLQIGTRRLPISLRNATAATIQLWSDRSEEAEMLARAASTTIGSFLGERFDRTMVVPGPLQLMIGRERLPHTFAAAIMGDEQLYLITAASEDEVARLPAVESVVRKALLSKNWALWSERAGRVIQSRNSDDALPSPGEVVLIVVLARVTTAFKALKLPKTSARVMPLPDFVTIFDSIADLSEFDRFWEFQKENSAIGSPVGLVDRFAAFRDSHALLVEGAITPTLIALDPLWGSRWRYRQLQEFWANAPPLFPYANSASWRSTRDADGQFRLTCRFEPVLSHCAVVGGCVAHVLFSLERHLEINDAQMLELTANCLADSLLQRASTIAELPVFENRRVVTSCHAEPGMLTTLDRDSELDERPLFPEWSASSTAEGDVHAHVRVNLQRVQQRLTEPVDARFEADVALAWIDGLNERLGVAQVSDETRAAILATGVRKPRFSIKTVARHVDVPQFADPAVPRLEQYKLARRDLALTLKSLGVKEGKYELAAAKAVIDPARDKFRELVHTRIALLGRADLIRFCIEQLDALMSKYDGESTRIQHSLAHEVSYDRAEKLAEAHNAFIKDSRNYRYLLECCVSAPAAGTGKVTEKGVVELVATIDWLQVLYGASDVLHNGIDVAGVEIDHSYVPQVFYSENREEREAAFAAETADLKLGVGVTASDAVSEIDVGSAQWQRVDAMFADQMGVGLDAFLSGLLVLSRWSSANGSADLRWSYRATREQIRNVMVDAVENLDAAHAEKIISLATLDATQIRRLLGKSVDESDVPIWEHNKRGDRYTIRPLIVGDSGEFQWGAAAAERAARIWRNGIANGYLPADFDWPKVSEAVRDIKGHLEERLEVTAHTIVQRATPLTARGIDFARRFPKEKFEDVGDYDVLSFWPSINVWLVIECKYNQPAFCLKDARRLRDRIFGTARDRAQFAKIERRRKFLARNADRLRTLLAWPAPAEGVVGQSYEVYVSRDIYWWMRNPPYDVPTHFVRVDVLDHWLRGVGLLG